MLANITTGTTNIDAEFAGRDNPFLRRHIPVTDITPGELENGSTRLFRLKPEFLEPAKLLGRSTRCRVWQADIKLCNLSTSYLTGIAHSSRNCADRLEKICWASRNDLAS